MLRWAEFARKVGLLKEIRKTIVVTTDSTISYRQRKKQKKRPSAAGQVLDHDQDDAE
jgi:hypothetical protein